MASCVLSQGGFFIFIFFIFIFTKIYFRVRNLHEYTPAAPLPGGWDLAARQPGGKGLSAKKSRQKIAPRSLEDRPPISGAASPPGRPAVERRALAARLRGDRPPTLYKVLAVPHLLICLTKNPEKKKREGGRERRGEGEPKRRSSAGFSMRQL